MRKRRAKIGRNVLKRLIQRGEFAVRAIDAARGALDFVGVAAEDLPRLRQLGRRRDVDGPDFRRLAKEAVVVRAAARGDELRRGGLVAEWLGC